jgi:hypothetical protein
MKNKAAGFYADSLEMMLDTMCNMLGGVVFIALMVAMMIHDAPPTAQEEYHQNAVLLTNQLAAVTASNAVVEADLQATLQRLQDPRHIFRTNEMRLPILSTTSKLRWPVIIRYNKLYPMQLMPPVRGAASVQNNRTIVRSEHVEPKPGEGDDPSAGVNQMIANFKASANTNYYFQFYVYEDSFDAFVRAREAASRLDFQYGWKPLPANQVLRASRQGESVLPQN